MFARENTVRRYRLGFFALLGILFIVRLWFMTTMPLSGDETYHWEWSRNLAFGYYDHPGLTGYVIRLFTLLCGRSTEFTVRLPALLLLSGTAVVLFYFARFAGRELGGTDVDVERAGFFAGTLVLVVPIFAFFSMYISTDPPLIFFWSLSMYLLCRGVFGGGWWIWIGAGVAVGLAMMSKFLAFFLLPGVLLFVLLSPRDRVWLRRPHPYVAAAVALLTFSPFLYWNATHGWATFMFNFVLRQKADSFALYHVPEFFVVQAAALSPGVFAFCLYAIWRAIRDWRRKRSRMALYLALCSLVPLSYFLYESLKQEVSPHWPAAGWFGSLVFLSCYWACLGSVKRAPLLQRLRRISLVIAVVMTVAICAILHVPPSWIRFSWKYSKNPSRIDTAKHFERFGWREMGSWVSETRHEMLAAQGSDGPGVFVICGKYAQCANVAFYTPDQLRTHLWGKKRVCGENYRFWDDFPAMKGLDALYVAKKRSRIDGARARLKRHFAEVKAVEELPIIVDGEQVRSFFLVRCLDYDGRVPDFSVPVR